MELRRSVRLRPRTVLLTPKDIPWWAWGVLALLSLPVLAPPVIYAAGFLGRAYAKYWDFWVGLGAFLETFLPRVP